MAERQFPTLHAGTRLVKAPIGIQFNATDPALVPADEGYFYIADGSHYGAAGDLVHVRKLSGSLVHTVHGSPQAQATRSTSVNVSGFTDLVFDDEVFDDRGDYDPGTGEFTAPTDGRYEVQISGKFKNHADGDQLDMIVKNNTNTVINGPVVAGGTSQVTVDNNKTLDLAEGDVLTFQAFESGSGCTLDANDASTYVEITQVR